MKSGTFSFLSVCAGIEAASVAWEPLGWEPVAFSEIEKFPSAVLAHHWPDVPNLGNITKWLEWPTEILSDAKILVGGTPCQAFSVAGLRNSLADERGSLTLTYVKILNEIDKQRARLGRPPAICLWENVPGVLSTKDNAFGCFLAALAGEHDPLQPPGGKWTDAGYVRGPERTIAWRILDAQHFGVPQRRRRVFVVASAGEGFRPEEILFESEGVRRDCAPSREEGERIAPCLNSSAKSSGGIGMSNQELFSQGGGGLAWGDEIAPAVTAKWPADIAPTLNACFGDKLGLENQHINGGCGLFVPATAHSLRGAGFDASEDGTGRGTPIVPVATQPGDMQVRRLTPVECARLQGFPDFHTLIPWRGKPAEACPDGPQYKAIGNSMAVPVMRWIGERISQLSAKP